ncbi:MAG: hypothetical protein ABI592_06015 [Acidobacteriota bacterium]
MKKKPAKAKKSVRSLGAKTLSAKQARNVKGGETSLQYKPGKTDGSLDAGIHFKYDIKP